MPQFVEIPVFVKSANGDLFGVLTRPAAPAPDTVVLLLSGGFVPCTHKNRFWTRMAWRLAEAGFFAMRFDYRGVGESAGETRTFRLDRPFVDDVEAVRAWVRDQGAEQMILVGTCFGARTALAYAADAPSVKGVALLAPPVQDFESGTDWVKEAPLSGLVRHALAGGICRAATDPRRRQLYGRILRVKGRSLWERLRATGAARGAPDSEASDAFLSPLAKLVARQVPVLIAIGSDDNLRAPFVKAATGRLGDLLGRAGPLITTRTMHGQLHGFASLELQDEVAGMIEAWLLGLGSPLPAGG